MIYILQKIQSRNTFRTERGCVLITQQNYFYFNFLSSMLQYLTLPFSIYNQKGLIFFSLSMLVIGPKKDPLSLIATTELVVHSRVANVVADHDSLLTQWRPMKMSKFCVNIFLIRTTSNYFWASEVFKNQRFKSHLFSFSQYKKYPKLKKWVSFYAIIILY